MALQANCSTCFVDVVVSNQITKVCWLRHNIIILFSAHI